MTTDQKQYSPVLIMCAMFALCMGVSGCATSALELAPPSSDKPWVPKQDKSGKAEQQTDASADFSVPANPALALIASPVAVNTAQTYNLAMLIDLAQRSNPATRSAWEKTKQAALAVGMSEAISLPMISANVIGGAQRATVPVDVPLIGRRDVETTVKGVAPAIALQWLVFDFGQRAALTEAARQVSFFSPETMSDLSERLNVLSRQILNNDLATEIPPDEHGVATPDEQSVVTPDNQGRQHIEMQLTQLEMMVADSKNDN